MRCTRVLVPWLLAACGPPTGPANGPPPPATSEPEIATTEQPQPALTVVEPIPSAAPSTSAATSEPAPNVSVTDLTGWSTFHGDSQRTGVTNAPRITKPRVRWKATVGVLSWLNSPLAVGKSVVLVPSSGESHNKPDAKDGVYAFDFASGRRAWFAHLGADANGAVASKTHVFATSDDEHLYALDIKTGKVAWKAKGEGKMYTHPLLLGDRVVVGDASGYVRAFATQDGKELWKVALNGAIRGGASSDGKNVFVGSQGGDVAALSAAGKTLWKVAGKRAPWGGKGPDEPIQIYSPPVVDKDFVYVPFARDTYYDDLPAIHAYDKKTGALRWKAKGQGQWGNLRSTPALVMGNLVWGEPYSGDVAAIDASTGRMRYREEIGFCFFPQWSSPAVASEWVYLPRFDGSVYALNAKDGRVEWEYFLGDSKRLGQARQKPAQKQNCDWENPDGAIYAPAAVAEDGTLFVGTAEGVLYAIGN